jgi:pimeloyl-ACP methyl ester carboxylesterase
MPHADLGDVSIYYEEAGDGPPFIHCHGLGSNSSRFVETDLAFWARSFRAVAWDNRGLGRSSAAPKYSAPLYAQDLARLMDHLGIERALVHGVSWGGVLVQQFVLDYPERCAGIILDSTSSEVNVASSEGWYARGERAKRGEGLANQDWADSTVAQSRAVAGLREHPYTPRLAAVTVPALCLGGGQDGTAGAGGTVILGRVLPNARTHIFQDAGHGIYREKETEFREMVLGFAREIGWLGETAVAAPSPGPSPTA